MHCSHLLYARWSSASPQTINVWWSYLHSCIVLISTHRFHLFYEAEWNPPPRIACIFFSDGALCLLGSLGSLSRIVRFSSPISRLGWEVFHQINQVRFFIEPTRSGPSPSLPASPYQSLVFLLSYPTGLGGFSPITLHGSCSFPPQFSHWVRRFSIDRSLIILIVRPGLWAWYSGI